MIRRKRIISLLNYIEYNKEQAMEVLAQEIDWRPYAGKHFESTYTRFFQGYYLPEEFNIDKRIGHLSDLINSGQLSRAEALEIIEQPTYPEKLQKEDLVYVKKKLGLSDHDWDEILNTPPKSFRDYPNNYWLTEFLRDAVNMLRKVKLYPR